MNNKYLTHFFGIMENKRVLNVDYSIESSSLVGPKPIKKNRDHSLQDNGFELFDTSNDCIQNHILVNNTDQNLFTKNDTTWIGRSNKKSFRKMDEDILQVHQHNLLHGPTLTELNASGSELEDFNLDDLLPADPEISEIPDTPMSSYLIDHVVNTSPVNLPSSPKSGFQLTPNSCSSSSSLSTGGVLTPETYDLSCDEIIGDSSTDTEDEKAYSSDIVSGSSDCDRTSAKSSSHEDRYCWQYNNARYNGQRLVFKYEREDPHYLNNVTDPVFSLNYSIKGIQHSGKAIQGMADDLKPNPEKLLLISSELDTLNKTITKFNELPFNDIQNKLKKKKSLLARKFRLKKKVQHEANKIKLFGLTTEQERLRNAISDMKQLFKKSHKLSNDSEKIVKNAIRLKVTGNTTQFVNKVLEKTKLGSWLGGLDEL